MPVDWDSLVLGPCMDTFGEPCRYLAAGRVGSIPFIGVFEEFHVSYRQGEDGAPVSDTRPVLGARLADLPGDPQREEVVTTADGRQWMIDDVNPDGVGHVKLMLKVAPNGGPAFTGSRPAF